MKLIKITKKDFVYACIILILLAVTISLSVMLAISKKDKEEVTYYEQKCQVFAQENVNFSKGQIVFIGDSITDGCALDNYYQDLPLSVYNRGIGGDNTLGVIDRLDSSLITLNPKKVVLLIGTNDINGKRKPANVLSDYEEILKTISVKLPDTKVYCISIPPMNKDLETYTSIEVDKSNATVLEVNPKIKELATKYGYEYVDIHTDLCDENGYLMKSCSPDGIHLNNEGYLKWVAKLKPLLLLN